MLTFDLMRASVRQGIVKPQYLEESDPLWLALADDVVGLFRLHIARTYGELRESLKELLGDGPEALVGRGLAKLLEDRATIEQVSTLDPREVRRRVFQKAAPHLPLELDSDAPPGLPGLSRMSRTQVLTEVAQELNTTPQALEQALYADLPDAHVVLEVDLPSPQQLLQRYNVALAQAVLLRAVQLNLTIKQTTPARLRQLFRYIRFFRLMYHVSPLEKGGYAIQLDGPLSLLKQSSRYGLQLAELLPALLLCEDWTLEAEVRWGRKDELKGFKLSPKQGLISHYPNKGVYQTREELWFRERFSSIKTPWQLETAERLFDLGGQTVAAPDLVLRHPDGREAYVELVGFWRRAWLESRLALYRTYGPGNLILAVSRQLQGSLEGLEGFEGQVYIFREVLVPKDLVALAEQCGRVPLPEPVTPEKSRRKSTRAEP